MRKAIGDQQMFSVPRQVAIVTSFATFSAVSMEYAPITRGAVLSCTAFVIPFLIAGILVVLSPYATAMSGIAHHAMRGILVGACNGAESAFILLSLITLSFWCRTPEKEELEPLFTAFAIVSGAFEGARRHITKILKKIPEVTQEQ